MASFAKSTEEEPVVRLSPSWDPSGVSLTPEEGFLLSRIDGRTSWAELRQIGGLSPSQVDACLDRWLSEGLIVRGRGEVVRSDGSGGTHAGPGHDDTRDPRLDLTLDLSPELQQQILDFEASLDRSYFELLDVPRDADAADVKRAYFALSKVYHPDRYFRANLGDYSGRLERIFRKLVEAYELLSDPATRAEIERTLGAPPPPAPTEPPEPPEPEAPETVDDEREKPKLQPAPRKLTRRQTLERLRRHFRIPEKVLAERRLKAAQFFESARVAMARERWIEAAPSLRLAIAFDPWNDEYRAEFADIQSRCHEQRAMRLLEGDDGPIDPGARHEALRLLEEVLTHRPADAVVNHRAAALALDLGEHERALEYAQAACDIEPGRADYHLLLGRLYRRTGAKERAVETLKTAASLDPQDPDIKKELLEARRKGRSS